MELGSLTLLSSRSLSTLSTSEWSDLIKFVLSFPTRIDETDSRCVVPYPTRERGRHRCRSLEPRRSGRNHRGRYSREHLCSAPLLWKLDWRSRLRSRQQHDGGCVLRSSSFEFALTFAFLQMPLPLKVSYTAPRHVVHTANTLFAVSRCQIWSWVYHGKSTVKGDKISVAYIDNIIDQEAKKVKATGLEASRVDTSAQYLKDQIRAKAVSDFLTTDLTCVLPPSRGLGDVLLMRSWTARLWTSTSLRTLRRSFRLRVRCLMD